MVAFEFIETRDYSSWIDEVRINKRAVRDFFVFGFASYGVLWTVLVSFGFFSRITSPRACFGMLLLYWHQVL